MIAGGIFSDMEEPIQDGDRNRDPFGMGVAWWGE